MSDRSILSELLTAEVGDGIQVTGDRYAVASIGHSVADDGFHTHEFTLGRDEDFYLVVEGPLDEGDPDRCRAVFTHEIQANEVRCVDRNGQSQLVTRMLQTSDNPPPEVRYHGNRYKFSRRVAGRYKGESRTGPRVTFDYERPGRNLAVERWPEHHIMAVYEGQTLPIRHLSFIKSYRAPAPASALDGATIGMVIGAAMMLFGFLLMTI